MALDSALEGRTFPPTAPYVVSRAKIAEFAVAIGLDPMTDVAPPTFPIVVAFEAMQQLIGDPSVGIQLQNVIHGDQRFTYSRPIRVGDELVATLTVESLKQVGGVDLIRTRTEVATVSGEPVVTGHARLVHRVGAP